MGERPQEQDPEGWMLAAIVVGAFVIALSTIYFVFGILTAPDDDDRLQRVQILAPLFLAGGAIVTFCTVVWRGLISSEQAKLQAQQLAGFQRQLAATDRQLAQTEESNVAKLFQDGVKMLADDKAANVTAGIATLSIVARGPAEPFGDQARVALLDYIGEAGKRTHNARNVSRAIAAARKAYEVRPVEVVPALAFISNGPNDPIPDDHIYWSLVPGVLNTHYQGGRFVNAVFEENVRNTLFFASVTFVGCRFNFDLSMSTSFVKCTFSGCSFQGLNAEFLRRHKITGCDFSGTTIFLDHRALPDLKAAGNAFHSSDPPRLSGGNSDRFSPEDLFIKTPA